MIVEASENIMHKVGADQGDNGKKRKQDELRFDGQQTGSTAIGCYEQPRPEWTSAQREKKE